MQSCCLHQAPPKLSLYEVQPIWPPNGEKVGKLLNLETGSMDLRTGSAIFQPHELNTGLLNFSFPICQMGMRYIVPSSPGIYEE